ncbi:MAG: beta-ketoacyl synthase chain length factor [Spirochaetes bacterium]|nr:beta-ketoacyl synthase chain length factor [Spirochaetota bacterium]
MTKIRVFVTGTGIISPIGRGFTETLNAIKQKKIGIRPLTLFPVPFDIPLPVGEILLTESYNTPRTHKLALIAAKEAVRNTEFPPDAIVLGTTTGGMDLSEKLIKEKNCNPDLYEYHSTGTVAEYIARELKCTGPVLTVSTACSSGTLAIKLAIELLRSGMAKTVLTGGADALCRLTYHGFNSLQLIDPDGAKPLDKDRKGMSIAEGAAMLLLTADAEPPDNAVAEILGAGLTCDAYHPASPHPEGLGASGAIKSALKDAGISNDDIDYVNLHGTGTNDNDSSEAKALNSVFTDKMPEVSSIKGACGHSLAAAGAIEAVISSFVIQEDIIPENVGLKNPDPELKLSPSLLKKSKINTVLSNSFGFGGNNASVVISEPEAHPGNAVFKKRKPLRVLCFTCITGAGNAEETYASLKSTGKCCGKVEIDHISKILPKNKLRRLKRLPKMVLSLAVNAQQNGNDVKPRSIYFGTGFGALSETYDFLDKLYESNEQFPSPTDFVGSVHNAPAGQASIWLGATGANITSTAGDYSFEQSLLCASLTSAEENDPMMVIGADEYHNVLTKILDRSSEPDSPSDGGGAFLLTHGEKSGLNIFVPFFEYAVDNKNIISSLMNRLGGVDRIKELFGAVFAGIPAYKRTAGKIQLSELRSEISYSIPYIEYRKFTGEFASASAVASVVAANCVNYGMVPSLSGNKEFDLNNKGILIIGFGDFITAIEIYK